jgi:hypothetical protein
MQNKHTPGPWKLGTLDITPFGTGLSMGIDAEGHGELAMVVWQMEDDQIEGKQSLQCEANAKLIAAAPDLLEALELMLITRENERGLRGQDSPLHDRARAAIAKARGQQ